MNYLLTNHRLNRCKPVQVKSADFSKLTITTIKVKLLDTSKTTRKFPFINPRYEQFTDAEVRIVTKTEITKLRKNGYVVEVVQKLPDLYPGKLFDVFTPTVKPIGTHGIETTTFGVLDGITNFGGPSLCCTSGGKPKGNGSLRPTTGNGRRARASCMAIPQNGTQQLLGRYVVLVKRQIEIAKEQAEIAREMNEIHAKLVDILPESSENTHVYNLFQPFADERKMSVCFSHIFQKFFGVLPTEKLEGDYNEQIDLIAYLFIIVEWEDLGSYIFKEKCKKPFFEYINENVLKGEIDVTERTFHNRLTRTMDDFRKKLAEEPLSSKFKNECWKNDYFIKDFLKVLRIFHGTEYYKELEMRKHA